jgi:peroxiredoxin
MAMAPSVGDPAPEFELPEAYGGSVRLSELKAGGSAVLVFYNGDFGIICSVEMKQFQRMLNDFSAAGARVAGICTNSLMVHSAWKEHMGLDIPLLSDFDGKVSDSYGMLLGGQGYLNGRSRRSVFIVDREGVIRYIWICYDDSQAEEPDYDELLGCCQAIGVTARAPAGRTPESSMP